MREQIDLETEGKSELQRQLSKANAEASQWRAKLETVGGEKADEVEDARRRAQTRVQELQEFLSEAQNKLTTAEKSRQRLQGELEDAHVDSDRANGFSQQCEKKQLSFDRIVEEWKRKCDDLQVEVDASQRETRSLSAEVIFREKKTEKTF